MSTFYEDLNVEGSGSERPAEPLSDEANDIIEHIRLMVEQVYEGNGLGHPLAINGELDRLLAILDGEARDTLNRLDGTTRTAVKAMSGPSDDEVEELGGLPDDETRQDEDDVLPDLGDLIDSAHPELRRHVRAVQQSVRLLSGRVKEAEERLAAANARIFEEATRRKGAEARVLRDDEGNERTLRDSWMAACETVNELQAEVERLTEEVESHKGAVSRLVGERMERVDEDGSALVTVRVSDLDWMVSCFGLMEDPRWMRLRRALDERGES